MYNAKPFIYGLTILAIYGRWFDGLMAGWFVVWDYGAYDKNAQ